ncbi:hypothetical protein GCM10018966_075050 [Streptomyces yanii]
MQSVPLADQRLFDDAEFVAPPVNADAEETAPEVRERGALRQGDPVGLRKFRGDLGTRVGGTDHHDTTARNLLRIAVVAGVHLEDLRADLLRYRRDIAQSLRAGGDDHVFGLE